MKNWMIYFRDYEDLDYEGPTADERGVVITALTKDDAILQFKEQYKDSRIIDIIDIDNYGII